MCVGGAVGQREDDSRAPIAPLLRPTGERDGGAVGGENQRVERKRDGREDRQAEGEGDGGRCGERGGYAYSHV